MTESTMDQFSRAAAKALRVNWNSFEIEYVSDNAIAVKLDTDGSLHLVERDSQGFRVTSERLT